jgi:glycerol kinase
MNLYTLSWDPDLLQFFNIPPRMLPQIRSCVEVLDRVRVDSLRLDGLPGVDLAPLEGVPIAGVMGDQHAALFGQACYAPGDAKCTYGTGAFLLMNTGGEAVRSPRGLLTTLAFQLGPGVAPVYALEGSVAYCGSSIQWLRDNLQLISDVRESEALAAQVTDNGGVYFVPAFAGLFAPHWRDDARGLIVGLTGYHTKAHVCRAALEATAFQVPLSSL